MVNQRTITVPAGTVRQAFPLGGWCNTIMLRNITNIIGEITTVALGENVDAGDMKQLRNNDVWGVDAEDTSVDDIGGKLAFQIIYLSNAGANDNIIEIMWTTKRRPMTEVPV